MQKRHLTHCREKIESKIRQLYSNGYNDVEIAKRLKIGVGEVRLVINLSSGNN